MISDPLLEKYRLLKKQNELNLFPTRSVRDLLISELTDDFWMVVACDSDGGIGPKKYDSVFSSAYDLGRFGARVPIMELLASGAIPVLIVDTLCVEMNPTGKEIICGIRDEASEAGMNGDLVVTGSTEDNVITYQTGIGVTVIGFVHKKDFKPGVSNKNDIVVCIGIPKSAPEYKVQLNDSEITDSKLIRQLVSLQFIHDVLPVGSKGIVHEFNELAKSAGLLPYYFESENIDYTKSGGPSTCCIASLPKSHLDILKMSINKPITSIGKLESKSND